MDEGLCTCASSVLWSTDLQEDVLAKQCHAGLEEPPDCAHEAVPPKDHPQQQASEDSPFPTSSQMQVIS